MEKTTVEVQIGWIEELLRIKNAIEVDKIPQGELYPFSFLLGYIESAKYLITKTTL